MLWIDPFTGDAVTIDCIPLDSNLQPTTTNAECSVRLSHRISNAAWMYFRHSTIALFINDEWNKFGIGYVSILVCIVVCVESVNSKH